MDLYASLLEIARLLLSEEAGDKTAEVLFRRLLSLTGAERGFIVVREGDSFEQKFDVSFDASVEREERRFSRTLVRQAIATREIIRSTHLAEMPDVLPAESVVALGRRAVLVAPLHDEGEVYGVVYLEHADRSALSGDVERFLGDFAGVAGLVLKRASEREALERRTKSLERDLFSQNRFEGIVTQDPKMLALLAMVAQVADSDATVLVRGETGTGKELVARALHVNSPRRSKPFVALHCTALPGTVLESELFGHVRGAFTGADRDRAGRIASANGGTLFLDEVAEIPPEVQAKLLRFLQFGEIQRLGSDRTERVDVRIVAATHQDLGGMIASGKFRQDLYYRLKLIELFIPPLRERDRDIPLLVQHHLQKHWRRKDESPRFSARAARALAAHDYPGNVRELAHAVERACLLARGSELDLDLLPAEMAGKAGELPATTSPFSDYTSAELDEARATAVMGIEKAFLSGLMERHGSNVSLAARQSGIHRSYLQKLLARYRAPAR